MTLPPCVWLSQRVLSLMSVEAEQMAPRETGGVLMGYWGHPLGEPVVTHWIGAGPHAYHGNCEFVPDEEYQLREIARLYRESDRRLSYLGDWHSHPGGIGTLSPLDRSTLKRIAAAEEARVSTPVMLIVAPGPRWEPTAHIARLRRGLSWRRALVVRSVPVECFDI